MTLAGIGFLWFSSVDSEQSKQSAINDAIIATKDAAAEAVEATAKAIDSATESVSIEIDDPVEETEHEFMAEVQKEEQIANEVIDQNYEAVAVPNLEFVTILDQEASAEIDYRLPVIGGTSEKENVSLVIDSDIPENGVNSSELVEIDISEQSINQAGIDQSELSPTSNNSSAHNEPSAEQNILASEHLELEPEIVSSSDEIEEEVEIVTRNVNSNRENLLIEPIKENVENKVGINPNSNVSD